MKTCIQKIFTGLVLLAGACQAAAQGTAFSYQGQLNAGGNPANGLYDVRFTVCDAVTNGNIIAGPLTNSATAVSNGLFSVTLDFGAGVFTGPARWLQLDVRTNGGGMFTPLAPREPVLPVPYAIMANSASNLLGTLPAAQLPAVVLTNGTSGVVLTGAFTGNGAGLTNLNATIPSTINENYITIGPTNVIAPLTVPPNVPAAPIGSLSTGSDPVSVAVAGRYAYVVSTSTLQIIDVNSPASPVIIGSVSIGANTYGACVAVACGYAYVAIGAFSGTLQVIDVSNPSSPVSVGSVATGALPISLAVAGRYAYVQSLYPNSSLQIIDISNPSSPFVVSSITTGSGNYQVAVAVSGRYAYSVSRNANTLQIVDVGNPASPVNLGSIGAGSGPYSIAVTGRYAYVADYDGGQLRIIDVNNPSLPVLVGYINTGSSPFYVAVAGRYAFVVSQNASSLQIFDVSNPSLPVSVGAVGTSCYPGSVAVSGRYAYEVTGNNGGTANTLQIFDLGGAYLQQLEAGTIETGTLQTRDTVNVGNNLNVRGGLTIGGSALISGGLNVNNLVGGTTTNISIGGHTFYITNGIIMNFQ